MTDFGTVSSKVNSQRLMREKWVKGQIWRQWYRCNWSRWQEHKGGEGEKWKETKREVQNSVCGWLESRPPARISLGFMKMPSMAFHKLCWLGPDMAWTSLWPWIGRPYCSPVTDSSASVALWRKRTASSRFHTDPPHWTVHSSRWSPSPSSPNALTSCG